MKHVSTLDMHNIDFTKAFAPQVFTAEFKTQTEPLINKLFAELRSICSAWRAAWPDQKTYDLAKDNWIKAFVDAGITSWDRVEYGLRKQRQVGKPFIPAVGEFINLCTPDPEEIGLPGIERAFAMAAVIAHPAADRSKCLQVVYHAACETGFHVISSEAAEKTYRLFKKHYLSAVEIMASGGKLRDMPAPPERMIAAIPTEQAKNKGRAALEALKSINKGTA
ncbi:MAG: replication protein P [Thiopseudomonas sp.]|nr:replication protein P [Thiopseudomonas sp.]